jgi:hypothetical protein
MTYRIVQSITLLACIAAAALWTAGCSNSSSGNRRAGSPMVTKATDLRDAAGKRVTLVGTARRSPAGMATLDVRGGTVELPDYEWPTGYENHPVEVTGTVVDSHVVNGAAAAAARHGSRVYRLGDIQTANRWSR